MNITEKKDPNRIPTRQEMVDKVSAAFGEAFYTLRRAEVSWKVGYEEAAGEQLQVLSDQIYALETQVKYGIN